MKKTTLMLLCATAVAFTACKQDEPYKPNGENNGTFSVSESKQVRFAQGNLQYTKSTDTWTFAEHQYDYIGEANVKDAVMADTIDLFGWSGNAYLGVDPKKDEQIKWGIGTSTSYNLYAGDFVDWGQNAIKGSDNEWRTLTNEEWNYLLNNRPNASYLKGVASVNGVGGLVLLPDNWQLPEGASFKNGFASEFSNSAYAAYQSYTTDQWQMLEDAGAVFLPAAGYRKGTNIADSYPGIRGNYWSATPNDEMSAYCLNFDPREATVTTNNYDHGKSVRLVQDVE